MPRGSLGSRHAAPGIAREMKVPRAYFADDKPAAQ